jgi:hypothetical protein
MVQKFVILKSPIFTAGSYTVPLYSFLQHGGTVVGMGLMLYWYFEWYKRAKVRVAPANLILSSSVKITIWAMLGIVSLIIAVISGLVSVPVFNTSLHYRLFIGQVFVTGVSAFIFGLALFSFFWYLKARFWNSADF